MMEATLHRIGYTGPLDQDAAALRGLHRAWRRRVPYENLDTQLGRPISLEPEALIDKIVRRGRGGTCFEQNGALAMLLRAAGFDVTMVEGAVQREARGESTWGNHSVLLVDLGAERWIADAGIGDGFVDPIPLREGAYTEGGRTFRLERLDAGTWRFRHHPGASIASYDFRLEPRGLADFAARSRRHTTDPESPYVRTLMAALPDGDGTRLLLSRTLRHLGAERSGPLAITRFEEFTAVLADRFLVPLGDLGPDGPARLWERTGAQDDLWRARRGNGA
jgi:N-hydroxyarylamine O-acetyltransferase